MKIPACVQSLFRRVFATNRPYVRFRSCLVGQRGMVRPGACHLQLTARRAAPSDERRDYPLEAGRALDAFIVPANAGLTNAVSLWLGRKGLVGTVSWEWYFPDMRRSDVTCPNCNAGYRRIELVSKKGTKGEFRCMLCDYVLEVFDGTTEVAIRLTVHPEKIFE
jgi:hypothetical protein